MTSLDRITVYPAVMGGKAYIRGMPVTVSRADELGTTGAGRMSPSGRVSSPCPEGRSVQEDPSVTLRDQHSGRQPFNHPSRQIERIRDSQNFCRMNGKSG